MECLLKIFMNPAAKQLCFCAFSLAFPRLGLAAEASPESSSHLRSKGPVVKVLKKREEGGPVLSTGFPVRASSGEIFIALSLHAVEDIAQRPEAVGNIRLADKNGEAFPWQARDMFFSVFHDLALIKLSKRAGNYKGPVFDLTDLREFDTADTITLHVPGFPLGQFKQLEIWNVRAEGEASLTGITYIPEILGTSGAPLINKEGAAAGVLISGDGAYTVSFAKAAHLKALLDRAAPGRGGGDSQIPYPDQVNSLLAFAEKNESPEAQSRLARLYADDKTSAFYNLDKSKQWRGKAAESGDTHSMIMLAKGHIEKEEHGEGMRLIRRAAEAEDPSAMFYLSHFYMTGAAGALEKSEEESMAWLIKSAGSSYPQAVERLAELHISGIMVPPDLERGLHILNFLAERGYAPAKETLSNLSGGASRPDDDSAKEAGAEQGAKAGACSPDLFL